MTIDALESMFLGGLARKLIPARTGNGATRTLANATPLITRSYLNIHPKDKIARYGSGEPQQYTSYWWSPSSEWAGENSYPLIPADQERTPNQAMLPHTLAHRLIFGTLLCWAVDTPLPKSRLLKGIGSPLHQSQAAALLGAWEDVGVLIKTGKGKTAAYKIVDGYRHGSWPGATNEQRKHCYQRILRYFPSDINLSVIKQRASNLKNMNTDAEDFSV